MAPLASRHLVEDQSRDLAALSHAGPIAAEEPGAGAAAVPPSGEAGEVLARRERDALGLQVRYLPQRDGLAQGVLQRVADPRQRDGAVRFLVVGVVVC